MNHSYNLTPTKMHMCTYIDTHTYWSYTHKLTCTYVIHAHAYTHTHTHTHTHIHKHSSNTAYIHTYTYSHTHTHLRACTRTHAHTHSQSSDTAYIQHILVPRCICSHFSLNCSLIKAYSLTLHRRRVVLQL